MELIFDIIALYNQQCNIPSQKTSDLNAYHQIIGTVYFKLDSTTYLKTIFDTIGNKGGAPNIESVFFANADKNKNKEIIIITSWKQRHYDVNGTLFSTFIFNVDFSSTAIKWNYLEKVSDKVSGGCDCSWRDGKSNKVILKTAREIRKKLIQLGFKQ